MNAGVAQAQADRGALSEPACAADEAPVRVLMVVQAYFPSVGGAERQALTLGRAFQESGHHVEVLCPRLDPGYPPGRGSYKGLPVWRIAYPRRAVVGWDSGRLAMVLAVLEARCGLGFGGKDVYLNVAGGLKIAEPAADLAVAAALISSAFDVALPAEGVVFGEIALSGEVRKVGRAEARLKEAAKLGFSRAIVPAGVEGAGLEVTGIDTVHTLVSRLDPGPQ